MGSGRGDAAGKPTARKVQSPSEGRMTWEANVGGRKAAGNRGRWLAPRPVVSDNWPDTGWCPNPKGC